MKRILVTGAGGAPSTNFVRSLRESEEPFHIVGVDANKYFLCRAETDEKYLIPHPNETLYIDILNDIIKETKVEFIYMQPDEEIFTISANRDKVNANTFLPAHKTIQICQNKFYSYQKWKEAGQKVPETIKINKANDLRKAFHILGKPIWIRAIFSPGGGKGSLKVKDFLIAKAWIDFWQGWGNFIAAEYIDGETVTWMSLWKDGKLIVAQGRKRLYWELSSRAPSGVTGITGAGITISEPLVDKIAQQAIYAIDKKPNGIFSVDMIYNDSVPVPTEINIGRFFTTHYFFTKAGLNMPYIFVKLAYHEKLPKIKWKINPLPPGLCWIRGMDFLPTLTHINILNKSEESLKERIKELQVNLIKC